MSSEEKPSQPEGEVVVPVNSELKHIIKPEDEKLEVPPIVEELGPSTLITGEVLKRAREAMKLSLKDLSQRTRISVASLSALETERWDDLPNARVYVRGFLRCVAVEIGIDRDQASRTYLPRWQAWYEAQNTRL
jgi:hypothetical protein